MEDLFAPYLNERLDMYLSIYPISRSCGIVARKNKECLWLGSIFLMMR